MKFSIVIISIIAATCILAAPKSFKALSKAKTSARLQALHKSTHLVQRSHSNSPKALRSMKHSFIVGSVKVVREQTFALKTSDGQYIGIQNEQGRATIKASSQITETERLVLVYLDNGKVAFYSPLVNVYLTAVQNQYQLPNSIVFVPHLDSWESFSQIANSDGTVSFQSTHGSFLKAGSSAGQFVFVHQPASEPFTSFLPGADRFELVDPTAQPVCLQAKEGFYLSIWRDQGLTKVGGRTQLGNNEQVLLVTLASGKTGIKSLSTQMYLAAIGGNDKISVAPQPNGWESWDRIANEDGSLSFRSHQGTYLGAQLQDGEFRLFQAAALGQFEKFNLADPKKTISYPHAVLRERPVGLQTQDGSFVSVRAEGPAFVIAGSDQLGATEVLTLVFFDNEKVAIRSQQGKFFRVASEDSSQVGLSEDVDDLATFDLINNPDNSATFRSVRRTYLRAEAADGLLRLDAQTLVGRSGLFSLVEPPSQLTGKGN